MNKTTHYILTVKHKDKLVKFDDFVEYTVEFVDGYYLAECKEYNLYTYAKTFPALLDDLYKEFSFLISFYCSNDDNELTSSAIKVKRKLLSILEKQ